MNRIRAAIVIAALSAMGLLACAGGGLPAATPADAERAQAHWPGTTTADLDRGRALYRGQCASCHRPIEPARIAPDLWPGHVAEMQERAGLGEDEANLVVRYLVTMSRRPSPTP